MKKHEKNFFKIVVNHIDETWYQKKKIHYPFAGKDFKYLKNYCNKFTEWGIMALWDSFIASESSWVKQSGYSLDAFFRCLPWLVDDPSWKYKAKIYEIEEFPPISDEILELFNLKDVENEKTQN